MNALKELGVSAAIAPRTSTVVTGGSSQPGGGPVRRRGRAFIRIATSIALRACPHLAPVQGFHARGRDHILMNG